jgi:hypothetical protein
VSEAAQATTARSNRWLRAVGYGFLAEAATIVTIIVVVVIYKQAYAPGLTDEQYAAFGQRAGGVLGIVAGTLYTFLFARALMPRLSERFVEHGLVLAATAVIFSVAGSIAGHQGVPSGYIIASALKLAAGALSGVWFVRSGANRGGV